MSATWSPRVLLSLLVVLVAALVYDLGDSPVSLFVALGVLLAVVVRVAVAATEPVDAETEGGDADDHDTS